MKVIGYVRVSTEGQVEGNGLEAQKKAIEDYCEEKGHIIVDWVKDEGESGAKFRRKLDELVLGELEGIGAIVVAKSDRVARDIKIYYYYAGELLKKNVELISVTEDFGQYGVFSEMLRSFTLTVAQMERENIKNRTMAGKYIKVQNGGWVGSKLPYGYRTEQRKLVVEPEEARVVKMIYELGKHMKPYQVKNWLNKYNYTFRGNPWRIDTVEKILDREKFYRGYYKWGNSDWVKGQHEAIL